MSRFCRHHIMLSRQKAGGAQPHGPCVLPKRCSTRPPCPPNQSRKIHHLYSSLRRFATNRSFPPAFCVDISFMLQKVPMNFIGGKPKKTRQSGNGFTSSQPDPAFLNTGTRLDSEDALTSALRRFTSLRLARSFRRCCLAKKEVQ